MTTDNCDEYVKVENIIKNNSGNNNNTIQLQPQDSTNTIKTVVVGNCGRVKQFINQFVLEKNNVKIFELLHDEFNLNNYIKNKLCPILEISIEDQNKKIIGVVYFIFTVVDCICDDVYKGEFQLQFLNINNSKSQHLHTFDIFINKRHLLEMIITCLTTIKY